MEGLHLQHPQRQALCGLKIIIFDISTPAVSPEGLIGAFWRPCLAPKQLWPTFEHTRGMQLCNVLLWGLKPLDVICFQDAGQACSPCLNLI